jgi:uncharacterized membrane protein
MLHFQQYSLHQPEIKTGNMSDEYYTTKTHSTDQNIELDKLCANVI